MDTNLDRILFGKKIDPRKQKKAFDAIVYNSVMKSESLSPREGYPVKDSELSNLYACIYENTFFNENTVLRCFEKNAFLESYSPLFSLRMDKILEFYLKPDDLELEIKSDVSYHGILLDTTSQACEILVPGFSELNYWDGLHALDEYIFKEPDHNVIKEALKGHMGISPSGPSQFTFCAYMLLRPKDVRRALKNRFIFERHIMNYGLKNHLKPNSGDETTFPPEPLCQEAPDHLPLIGQPRQPALAELSDPFQGLLRRE